MIISGKHQKNIKNASGKHKKKHQNASEKHQENIKNASGKHQNNIKNASRKHKKTSKMHQKSIRKTSKKHRYALSFITPKQGDIFITFAFIALDGDNLGDGIRPMDFLHDYGNNKINHFLSSKKQNTKFYSEPNEDGNGNSDSDSDSDSDRGNDEDDRSHELTEEQIILKEFIPIGVLKYLSS